MYLDGFLIIFNFFIIIMIFIFKDIYFWKYTYMLQAQGYLTLTVGILNVQIYCLDNYILRNELTNIFSRIKFYLFRLSKTSQKVI